MDRDNRFGNVFSAGVEESKGKHARSASSLGALAISDLVRSTLGPKGMDKILQSAQRGGSLSVTNDGATILNSINVDDPAARIMIDISKVQDDEVGDGTTSVVILAGELLREAGLLIERNIHPTTVITGLREACEKAHKQLELVAFTHGENSAAFRKDLINVAKTTISSKILANDKIQFAHLASDAVLRLRGSGDLDMIHIIKKTGGTLKDSFLDDGFIIDRKIGVGQPRRLEQAKILLANTSMDTDKIKIYGAKVKSDSLFGIASIETAEKKKMKAKCDSIKAHGVNCFINRQLIYNYPEQIFTQEGIVSIEHVDFDGIERLSKVLGGDIVSTFDYLSDVTLGSCELIEEFMIGEDKVIRFSGVRCGQACTVVLRGASSHVLDEAERSLHDALCVLVAVIADSRFIYGGGNPEMQMSRAIEIAAERTLGKKSLAMQSFARALRKIPEIICENAGLDSTEIVSSLRSAHSVIDCRIGVDVILGEIGDMEALGVIEAFVVKLQMLLSATEAAECILRVDQILRNAPKKST